MTVMAESELDQQQDHEGVEQPSEEDAQAARGQAGVDDSGTAGGDEALEAEATELISKERYDELKSDPDKLHKELVRAANKKFREVAAVRKSLKPYAAFIEALDRDPRKAVMAVGEKLGMKFVDSSGGEGAKTTEEVKDEITAKVRTALGEEYGDLADKLIPAIQVVAESVASKIVGPLTQRQEELIQDSAQRESNLALEAFAKKHPDWKKHEGAMVELSEKLQPAKGMSESEYLENLYFLVTREMSSGDEVRRTVDRMRSSASGASGKSSSVPGSKVAERPAKLPSFREAADAALRGERFE